MAYTERLEMMIDVELLRDIDEWRSQQRPLPSRAQAIRVLCRFALDQRPKLRPAEVVAKVPQDCP